MAEYINKEKMLKYLEENHTADEWIIGQYNADWIYSFIEGQPTADVVEVNKYNELREDFIDFVCSGVHNPAPYCKNRCSECVDSSGWCTYRRCIGFNPDGKRRDT